MKTMARTAWRIIAIIPVIFLLIGATFPATAASSPPKVIRVGWYDYTGFLMMDKSGQRSGYAYDYMQELARYGGWSYEYVPGTVEECMQRLAEGKIDLISSVMHSSERAETMSFSQLSMGKNYSVITTRADDTRYQIGDYASLDGIHIGVLSGDVRQDALKQFAQTQGFTYHATQFDTPTQIEQALREKTVDAMLATNMRVSTGDEQVVAQFAPTDFFFVTAKGNDRIMQAVNAAMEQIEFTRKGFQSELAQKYFSVDMSGALALTREERAFLRQNPRITVLIPAPRQPMAYEGEDGEFRGIVVDVMDEIAARLGVTFTYLPATVQADGVAMVSAGRADLIANVYNDYSWAESNRLFLSRPYTTLTYSAVARVGVRPSDSALQVAAVRGYRFSADYIVPLYPSDQVTWYSNEGECLDAVRRGDCDICFVSTLVAAEFLSDYRYRYLYSSPISYSHGLSIGVSKGQTVLLSLMDKAIASMGENTISGIIDANTLLQERQFSFGELAARFPLQFIAIFGTSSLSLMALITILLVSYNNRRKDDELHHARLAAEHDALTGLYNRLAFEVVVTQKLQESQENPSGVFVMLDIDRFKQVNDEHGHRYGDTVLRTLALRLRELFEVHGALSCRMGGDEFALFFPCQHVAANVVDLLRNGQTMLAQGEGTEIAIPCSFGVVFVTETLCDFPSLYQAADEALYSAKRDGKGVVHISGNSL